MEISIDQYLQEIPNCSWSRSDQYFSDHAILHEIGFTGVMDTDTFIETSFTTKGPVPVSGALIKTFTNDNIQHEIFVVYTLSLPNMNSNSVVKITLQSIGLFTINALKSILLSIPLIALIALNLFTYIMPPLIQTVLFYLSFAAILFVISVYIFKAIPMILNFFREKKYFIEARKITYIDERDASIITDKHIKALSPLIDENINSVVIFYNKMFLKQSVDSGFSTKAIQYLSSENFQNNF